MFKLNLKSEKGFSLPEIMIATAIMAVVAYGGFQAYEYFIKETKKEAAKMDDLSEFNLLTKDLLKFAEGAGISTAYLNLPIKVKDCNATEPCIRKLENENLIDAPPGDLPDYIKNQKCVQFYRDAKGLPEGKKAFPDKTYTDKVYEIKDLDVSTSPVELFASWTLKDPDSPPVIMMKTREGGIVLNYIKASGTELSRDKNTSNIEYSFFQSDYSKAEIMKLKDYPFLIYNTLYNNQYVIQYAADIISCEDNKAACQTISEKIISPFAAGNIDPAFPTNIYIIKFKSIDFTTPFFTSIITGQKLPGDCKFSWGEGKQSLDSYFFPSTAYSVWQEDTSSADLMGPDPLNIFHLSHYYTSVQVQGSKGIMVALPIDIFSYKVELQADKKTMSLVSELWHASEIKKKVKISNLKGPFTLTRKIGSAELGIWYNPLKAKKGATP